VAGLQLEISSHAPGVFVTMANTRECSRAPANLSWLSRLIVERVTALESWTGILSIASASGSLGIYRLYTERR
jgi:hypothetical protein